MADKPKILCVCKAGENGKSLPVSDEQFDVVKVYNPLRALVQLSRQPFDGVYVDPHHFDKALQIGRLLQNERVLQGMPDGVALLQADNQIVWANDQFINWSTSPDVAGKNFYEALGSPEILGPDFCPFHTAMATRHASSSTLRTSENRYFQVHAAPVSQDDEIVPEYLIITLSDISAEMIQQQKLEAIHRAGIELADLTAEEVLDMDVDDRIELLKSNILHFTKDLLNFDVVEIRLLDANSKKLTPLLTVGMDDEAKDRILTADTQGNGVTGFVAATAKSYLCEDTSEDPLYLEGFKGAKSSLTVPLIFHDQVVGTFNVESPEPRAFTDSDLQFLEIFARDLAMAINTLDLLVAEKANTAQQSVEAIHSAVALPVDEILNDAVNVMERYIGHEPEVVQRLRQILRNARDIKTVIQKVGQTMAPAIAVPASAEADSRPLLKGSRVLVVDADGTVRSAAHDLLERYGCVVETAHEGEEAILMVRNLGSEYDVIISDIKLPDSNGHQLMLKLQELLDHVPLVLMTGFGYDPGHSIVKARQAGLHPKAILYKPFRLDQLLETVELMIGLQREVSASR